MKRTALRYLQEWLIDDKRLPLVLRGACQVGKTWLVEHFAQVTGKQLIEVNIERQPKLIASFRSNDPKKIITSLANNLEISIDPKNAILFIDEIQAAPDLFAKLRWFAEDMPELPVIAAGSLLEFILGKYPMSMPVGRITYMFLEPRSFEEFLLAQGRVALVSQIKNFNWNEEISEMKHEKLTKLFIEYIIVGGMPAAVQSWIDKKSPPDVSRIHTSILQTYRDYFKKYSGHLPTEYFNEVLTAVPSSLGKKFVYSQVNRTISHTIIKEVLELLIEARLSHKVQATASNGIPLGAEKLPLYTKIILLDVGLSSADLGLSLADLQSFDELDLINKGGIAEQIVGKFLRAIEPFYKKPELYYWVSTDKYASAEVDYVIQHGTKVIPIEVKAGTAGSLKSLHRFMFLKELSLAVRINLTPTQLSEVNVKDAFGNTIQYQLRSIPFYLIGELHRLLG